MILLFGEKAGTKMASRHSSRPKSNPVENSGILAMNSGMSASQAKSLLTMGEYDTFISSNPYVINYAAAAVSAQYYSDSDSDSDSGFLAGYSEALAAVGDGGGFVGGDCCCASSCGSFSSVC